MNENNSEEEFDELTAKITERYEQSIIPLLEDVADWLSKFMNIKIYPVEFMSVLDDGVILCRLAEKIQKQSEAYTERKRKHLSMGVKIALSCLPPLKFRYHDVVKKGSFFARENAANFIKWCSKIGIQDSTLFESEGLVSHRQLKNVVLTLLELTRIGACYEVEPIPSLIKLEKEIEQEEINDSQNVTIRKKKEPYNLVSDSKVFILF